MSANINQVFIANPITTNASTDLMYFGQSPYTTGNDAAMLFSDFAAQFATSLGIQRSSYNYAVDTTGTGDHIVVAYNPPITSLTDGMLLIANETVSADTGTARVRIDVNGIPNTAILIGNNGSPVDLYPGDIGPFTPAVIIYNATLGGFFLLNPQSAMSLPDAIAKATLYTIFDTGTANTYTGAFSNFMSLVSPATGFEVNLVVSHTNTGASTFNLNGNTPATAVVQKGGAAITAGMMTANYISKLIFTGSNWQLMNPA